MIGSDGCVGKWCHVDFWWCHVDFLLCFVTADILKVTWTWTVRSRGLELECWLLF